MSLPHRALALTLLVGLAAPALARTPTPSLTATPTTTLTHTAGPSPTPTRTGTITATASPTRTGTPHGPFAAVSIAPPVARSGQRVVLDGRHSEGAVFYRWSQADGDVAIEIEDADQPAASFVVPALGAPAIVSVRLDIDDSRQWPAYGIQLLPANTAEVLLTHDSGPPGGTAAMHLVLRPWGLGVTALTHAVGFDAFTGAAARGDGSPDCAAGAAIDLAHAAFAFTPAGCTPGSSCTGLRAEVVARQAMPPEAIVYACRVAISDAPRESCQHVLACAGGSAVSADGVPLTLLCTDGSISADYTREAPAFTFRAEPPDPMVGDTVELIFTTAGNGGLPGYTLVGAEPILHVPGPTPTPGGGPLAREVRFSAIADCPGTAALQLSVYYEGRGGCPGNEYFNFRSHISEVFPLVVREPGSAVLRGRVGAFTQTCAGARSGALAVLEPLGWRAVSGDDGTFSFGGVPPGDYSVHLEPPCALDVCWPPQELTVSDAGDAEVVLCPLSPTCPGDCDNSGQVDVAELVRGVQITLGTDDRSACPAADSDADLAVTVDDLVRAINAALSGCT